MDIELRYIFDDDGWVLPFLTVDGEPLDESLEAVRIAQDDDERLKMCGFDPLEIRRRWVENYGLPE